MHPQKNLFFDIRSIKMNLVECGITRGTTTSDARCDGSNSTPGVSRIKEYAEGGNEGHGGRDGSKERKQEKWTLTEPALLCATCPARLPSIRITKSPVAPK
jgi:hypothetical protein